MVSQQYEEIVSESECQPDTSCKVKTPYGTARGRKCPLDSEVNRLVDADALKRLLETGWINPSRATDVISLSACPKQRFGGKIRLYFDTEKIRDKLIPMCYLDYKRAGEKQVRKGMEEEVQKELMEGRDWSYDWVRAKYKLSPATYEYECEYMLKAPLSIYKIKRIEYWIAGMNPKDYNTGCTRLHPHIAGAYAEPQEYIDEIQIAKQLADNLEIPFEVKSCFNSMIGGWDKAIELTDKNLQLLAAGRMPEIKNYDAVPKTCTC